MNIKLLVFMVMANFVFVPSLHAQEKLTFTSILNSSSAKISEQVIREAYRRLGYDINVVWVPARRALEMANDGQVDGELHRILGIDKRWVNLMRVPNRVNVLEATAFTKSLEFKVAGWNSLKPYSVGVRRGIQFSNANTQGMSRQVVNTVQGLFEILQYDRIEVVVTSLINGLSELKEIKHSSIKLLKPAIEVYPLYHYLHKKHQDMVPKVNGVLEQMKKEGLIEHIRQQALNRLRSEAGRSNTE